MAEKRIVLIRAVNVGGTAKLPMARLRALAEELGATDVATYIASGNLVCSVQHPDAFDRALEAAIESEFGFFREVISRSAAEVQEALDAFPFEVAEDRFAYITFLTEAPAASAVSDAAAIPAGDDRWQLRGRELFTLYANGAGQATLNASALHRKLGVEGTARNLTSVHKLIALAG